jgi:uncharacterized protein (TIGR03437 family)
LLVESPLGISDVFPVTVAARAPGIFLDAATGAGAVLVAGSGTFTQARPVKPGEFLEIYCTGLGLAPAATVTIAGVPATVTYAGSAAVQGLQQVNVRVPEGVSPGSQALVLTVGGVQANTVQVQVTSGP